MRNLFTTRWLSMLLVVAVLAMVAGASPAKAAPPRQTEWQILARGFVDLFGGDDPNCPGCNGEYDPEDEEAATSTDPLGEMTFRVLDIDGNEVASDTTSDFAGLQRVSFMVPQLATGETYTLELVSPPAGWQLCQTDTTSVVLQPEDFAETDSVAEDFHFWKGCQSIATPTPTEDLGGPTPIVTAEPTKKPSKDKDDDKDDDKNQPASQGSGGPGAIKGLAFIDLKGNGILDPDDPGLNDVRVNLHGGGLQLFQITGATGTFSFEGLGPGQYDLFIQVGPEWKITTRASYTVHVNGNVVVGNDFGLSRGAMAAPAKQMVAGRGIRLPSTGIADLPVGNLLGAVALVLGMLSAAGFAADRRRNRL